MLWVMLYCLQQRTEPSLLFKLPLFLLSRCFVSIAIQQISYATSMGDVIVFNSARSPLYCSIAFEKYMTQSQSRKEHISIFTGVRAIQYIQTKTSRCKNRFVTDVYTYQCLQNREHSVIIQKQQLCSDRQFFIVLILLSQRSKNQDYEYHGRIFDG